MNKHVMIVENSTSSLAKNESVTTTDKKYSRFIVDGIFTEFDIENRNKRMYTAENFVPKMQDLLMKKEKLGVLYGEYDHPDVFDITCKNLSHAIESLTYNEQLNRIDGSISILSNKQGSEAKSIINDGYPLFVSSRAAGITEGNGKVLLKELFTYDIVADPGFSSARVTPKILNESLGFSETVDVPYRIYEMNDNQVNDLFNDNNNNKKTQIDLNNMEEFLKNEMAKLENKIMQIIAEKKYDPQSLKTLTEKHDVVADELNNVQNYLKEFKKNFTVLVKENINVTKKSNELIKENSKLKEELTENVYYMNHLSTQIKKLNDFYLTIENRINVDEKFMENVAKHTKANILFTTDVAKELETVSAFTESIAKETEIGQKFAELTAKELEVTQKFVENTAQELEVTQKFAEEIAKETEVTQKFAEEIAKETEIGQKFSELTAKELEVSQEFMDYVANEKYKDEVYLEYIGNKLNGGLHYIESVIDTLKSNTPVNENSTTPSIHSLENIFEYLGVDEENEILNNVQEDENTETQSGLKEGETTQDVTMDNVQPVIDNTQPMILPAPVDNIMPVENTDIMNQTDTTDIIGSVEPQNTETVVSDLVSSIVKIIATEETGIVMEVLPDGKILIKKQDSDETMEFSSDEVEVLDNDDNLTERLNNVLSEIKKQKVLSNSQPHFYTFLNDKQLNDFKELSNEIKESVILKMNESEYTSTEDVLNIMSDVIVKQGQKPEEKLINTLPEDLKEEQNKLTIEAKKSIIKESNYFPLINKSDYINFQNTRPFAKSIVSPEAKLIKESNENLTNEDLSDDYVNNFLTMYNKLK